MLVIGTYLYKFTLLQTKLDSASKEELQAALQKRTDQCKKLETKVSGNNFITSEMKLACFVLTSLATCPL